MVEPKSFKVGCFSLLSAGFNLTSNSLDGDRKIQMYHHYVEAAKFANGQKRNINDPAFNNGKVGT